MWTFIKTPFLKDMQATDDSMDLRAIVVPGLAFDSLHRLYSMTLYLKCNFGEKNNRQI